MQFRWMISCGLALLCVAYAEAGEYTFEDPHYFDGSSETSDTRFAAGSDPVRICILESPIGESGQREIFKRYFPDSMEVSKATETEKAVFVDARGTISKPTESAYVLRISCAYRDPWADPSVE